MRSPAPGAPRAPPVTCALHRDSDACPRLAATPRPSPAGSTVVTLGLETEDGGARAVHTVLLFNDKFSTSLAAAQAVRPKLLGDVNPFFPKLIFGDVHMETVSQIYLVGGRGRARGARGLRPCAWPLRLAARLRARATALRAAAPHPRMAPCMRALPPLPPAPSRASEPPSAPLPWPPPAGRGQR